MAHLLHTVGRLLRHHVHLLHLRLKKLLKSEALIKRIELLQLKGQNLTHGVRVLSETLHVLDGNRHVALVVREVELFH